MALLAIAGACSASPEPAPSGVAAHSERVAGPFLLSLDLPSDTWIAGQPIVGDAHLRLIQGGARQLSGSGHGVLGFDYAEVGGRRRMGGEWTADCAQHLLMADQPFTEPLGKSGGFSNDDPDAAFYRAFLEAPFVALPAGIWDISAVAYFIDGPGCDGQSFQMATTVRVIITP